MRSISSNALPRRDIYASIPPAHPGSISSVASLRTEPADAYSQFKHVTRSDELYENGGGQGGLILQALIPFAHRWLDISLRVPFSALNSLTNIAEEHLPMLKTLHINEIAVEELHEPINWGSFGLLRGPDISSFTFFGTNTFSRFNIDPQAFPLRWDQLVSLCITGDGWAYPLGITSDMALAIFSRCPHLHNCRLLVNDESAVEIPHGTILELPCLRWLHIVSANIPVNRQRGLFSRLLLPELWHLGLHLIHGFGASGNIQSFFPLFTICPRLESAQLNFEIFDKQSLMDLLRTLPPIIQRCPLLRELQLNSCYALSDQALLLFIIARMAVKPPTLRRVQVNFTREIQSDIRPDIQPFLDAGLELDATYF
ncbi:hypothetical protein K438DRAFT_1998336 [Mycena galopus ATCC 62051]|nr:hypothetical protein K438DRAFT_1998336 [Mycena galopus ATCC 62051]